MIQVFDNFVPNPDFIRQSALNSGFGTWKPNKGEVGSSVYTGMNFWGDHAPLLRGLHRCLNLDIYPNSMFFRVCNEDTEGAYVHSDREAGDITAIVYLSKHEGSGTGFYRHRETGMENMPSFAKLRQDPELFEKLKHQMVKGDPHDWEQIEFVEGKYNRCLAFHAHRFHARHPKNGFGMTAETGRMVWVCHLKVLDG